MRLWLVLMYLTAPLLAQAQALVADLSSHIIAIRADFEGEDLVLFGALDQGLGANDNVLVSIRGPQKRVQAWRKRPVAGFWLNGDSVVFPDVPSFYRFYSARAMIAETDKDLIRRRELGVNNLRLHTTVHDDDDISRPFQTALKTFMQAQDLYTTTEGPVTFLGDRLFRSEVAFPQNVPIGLYWVETLLVRDGAVIAAQTTPLHVSKDGLGADIAFFAQTQPLLYAGVCLVFAWVFGWLAAFLFRKG